MQLLMEEIHWNESNTVHTTVLCKRSGAFISESFIQANPTAQNKFLIIHISGAKNLNLNDVVLRQLC